MPGFGVDTLYLNELTLEGDRAAGLNVDVIAAEGEAPQTTVWVGDNYNIRFHFGNPFTTRRAGVEMGRIKVANQLVANKEYRAWLLGEKHKLLEVERRQWILAEIRSHQLENRTLLCGCEPNAEGTVYCRCHKQVLLALMERSEFLHRDRGTDALFWEMF